MRAERRVAEAALEAANAQAARFAADAERLAQQLGGIGDGSSERSAIEQAGNAAEQAARQLAQAETALVEAERLRAAAAESRDEAESGLAAARAAWSAAKAERDALARALDHGGGAALTELKAAPGYERALAAALGEDIEAVLGSVGQRRWQGSEAEAGDPRNAVVHPDPRPVPLVRRQVALGKRPRFLAVFRIAECAAGGRTVIDGFAVDVAPQA